MENTAHSFTEAAEYTVETNKSNSMTTSLYKEEQTATELIKLIEKWGADRNFYGIGGATVQSQFVKLAEELGEMAGNIARGKDCKDDIGDMVVVLTHIARLAGTNLTECIKVAYNDIKDRKGEFKNGSFIKESDL